MVGKEEAPQPQRPQFEQQNAAHIRTKFLPGDSCGEVLAGSLLFLLSVCLSLPGYNDNIIARVFEAY